MKILTLLTASLFISILFYKVFLFNLNLSGATKADTQKVKISTMIPPTPAKKVQIIKAVQTAKKPVPTTNSQKSIFHKQKVEPKEPIDPIANDKHYAIEDPQGNLVITSITVSGDQILAHGDIIVDNIKNLTAIQNNTRLVILPKPKIWSNGIVPYTIQRNHPNQEAIIKAIEEFHKLTNIRFIERTDEKNYVIFKRGNYHCSSRLGMVGGAQLVNLSPPCGTGEVIHELMHTIGFLHEQNRTDRDEHINILWENIAEENHLQFKKISNRFRDQGSLPFDFKSIMLYDSTFFSRFPGDFTIVKKNGDSYQANRVKLSSLDIRKINELYPASKDPL